MPCAGCILVLQVNELVDLLLDLPLLYCACNRRVAPLVEPGHFVETMAPGRALREVGPLSVQNLVQQVIRAGVRVDEEWARQVGLQPQLAVDQGLPQIGVSEQLLATLLGDVRAPHRGVEVLLYFQIQWVL